MFSFFKKNYHEPVAMQLDDLKSETLGHLFSGGEDCDEIIGAEGEFGHCATNPIPVNGLIGTYKYLGKLLSPKGNILYFHRLGSISSETGCHPIDAYEVVDMDGSYWDVLYLDMYHPRRSNKLPEGYRMKRYDKIIGDIAYAFGVHVFCPDFPYDLSDEIEMQNNLPAFARRVREHVANGDYDRDESHQNNLSGIKIRSMIVS